MANRFLNDIRVNDSYTLPTNDGSSGQAIITDGSGNLSFGAVEAGSADKALSLTLTVKNTESVALTKGQVVCAAPSSNPPSGNVIEVKLADNNGTNSMPAIGVLNEGLDAAGGSGDEGEAIMFGRISGINTSAFSVGDEVFVSDTPGGLTITKPTGVKYIQKIGVVMRDDANNGTIEIFGAGRTNDVPTPLYIDHANQRLGIGVEDPAASLHVNGAIVSEGGSYTTGIETMVDVGLALQKGDYIKSDDGNYLRNIIGHTTSGIIEIGQGGTALISDIRLKPGSSGNIIFEGSGSEDMRIDSSGNVGIGTASPDRRLHVESNNIVSTKFEGTNTGHLIDLFNTNNSPTYNGIRFTQGSTAKMAVTHIADGTTKGYVQIGNSWATGSEILVADGRTSRVGIGEISPLAKLHVKVSDTAGDVSNYGKALIEDVDAQLDLLSTSDGTWGSAVNFIEAAGSGANTDVWSIARQTTGGNGDSSLNINFGPGNQHDNVNKFKLDTTGSITIPGNATVGGNLIVNGTTTTLNTTTVEVEDNILQLNTTQGSPDTATAATSGISVYRGDGITQASLIFNDADDTWDLTNNLVVSGNISAANLSGTNTGDQDLSGYLTTAGKAADSNLLDGIDSGSFLRSNAADTATGTISFAGGINVVTNPLRFQRSSISQTGQDDNVSVTVDDNNIYFTHNNDNDGDASGFNFRYSTDGATADLLNFSASTITYKGNTIWHAGNDGAGSGLDADTLDGIDSGSFLRSDAADTATGQIFFDAGFDAHPIMLSGAQNFDNIDRSGFYNLYNTDTGSTNSPGFPYGTMIAIGNDKQASGFGLQIAHERTGTGMYVRGMNDTGNAWSNWAEIWTSETDGSGSGLDADTLDGQHASTFLRSDQNDTTSGLLGVNTTSLESGVSLTLGRTNGLPSIKADSSNGGYLILDSKDNFLSLNHYVNQKVIIGNGGGNVGIGTTSPQDKLHVYGGRLVLDNVSAGQSAIQFNSAGVERSVIYRPGGSNDLQFYTDGGGDVLRITNAGSVGIGTTSPSGLLHLSSNAPVIAGTSTNNSSGLRYNTVGTAGDTHRFQYNGTTQLNIKNSGNVGIGTTTPGAKLDINDDIQIDTYAAGTTIAHNAGYIRLLSDPKTGWAPGDELGKIEFYSKDTSGIGQRNAASIRAVNNQGNGSSTTTFEGELAFYTSLYNSAEQEAVRINSDGNVGIGTTSPAVSLDINATDAVALPTGTTAERPSSPAAGMFRYNTDDDQFEGYTTEWGAIAGSGGGGGGTGEIVKETFSGTGSQASFALSDTIVDIDNVNVYVDGVYQYPSNYTVSGNTVTFVSGSIPASGTDNVHIRHNVTAPTLTEGAAFSTSGNLVGDGATLSFSLGGTPRSSDHTMVFLEGVYQEKENYSISGSNIIFTTAPPNGYSIEVKYVTGVLDLTGVGEIVLDELTGNGTTTYALSSVPVSENYTNVYIEGVYQEKGTYSVAGSNIVFSSNVPTGYSIEVSTHKTIPSSSVTQTTFETDSFTANGTQTNFALVNGSPVSKSLTMVFIQGVYQAKSNYNLVSNEIQFTAGIPAEDDVIEVISMSAINTAISPVTSVNGEIGAVTISSDVTSVQGKTGAVALVPADVPGVVDTSDNTTGLTFWTGTQAEYDALGSYDSNKLYFIT